MQSLCHCRRDP